MLSPGAQHPLGKKENKPTSCMGSPRAPPWLDRFAKRQIALL